MPRPALRRPVSVATMLVVSAVCLALSPLLLAAGALFAALTGDRRLAILTRIFLAYLVRELAVMVACGLAWVVSGAGAGLRSRPGQALHWALLRWYVAGLAEVARRGLDLRVAAQPGSEAAAAALREDERPLLVLSRHAGPADTVLLIDRLLSEFHRRPSVVLKESVALDPAIDLLTHRLPHAVLDSDEPDEACRAIADTTRRLGPRGVLLLFPEGGNFTAERRRSVLRSLRHRGLRAAATRAARLEHVLPPRPAGTLAALDAAPDADVVFAAHTGLGLAAYPLQIYRELPIGGTLRTRMWLVARREIPVDEDGRCAWLNDWWRRIDEWVDAVGVEPGPPPTQTTSGAGA